MKNKKKQDGPKYSPWKVFKNLDKVKSTRQFGIFKNWKMNKCLHPENQINSYEGTTIVESNFYYGRTTRWIQIIKNKRSLLLEKICAVLIKVYSHFVEEVIQFD